MFGILQVSFEVTVVSAKARGLSEGRPEVNKNCDSSEKKGALKGYCYCLLLCEATHQLSRETVPGERQKRLQLVLYHFNTSNELLQLEL